MKKKINYILAGRSKQITPEESVLQLLPQKDFRFANPFIVIHHKLPERLIPGSLSRIHPHPHRGFSPVTFMLQGEGFHKDNAGHETTIREGDVQWMFAGSGILHSEGPTEHLLQNGGWNEFIQIWVNVPKAHKWDAPFYQSAAKKEQPAITDQKGVDLRLASGNYEGITGPLQSKTPVISIEGEITQGKQVQLAARPGYWTLLYVIKGSISINQESIQQYHLVIFEKDNDEILITAQEDTRLLFLSAEPINEPVAAQDNFVMNTTEEIEQAITDAKNGLFGSLDF